MRSERTPGAYVPGIVVGAIALALIAYFVRGAGSRERRIVVRSSRGVTAAR
jgi:hypothetical protein